MRCILGTDQLYFCENYFCNPIVLAGGLTTSNFPVFSDKETIKLFIWPLQRPHVG